MTQSEIIEVQQNFGEYLINFIQSKVQSHEDAQDIYQEVIIKLISKSDQLKESQSLKSWLFTIANNQIIDFYRTRKSSVDIDNLPLNSFTDQEVSSAYKELAGCLSGFINRLPEEYQQIITLSEIQGYSQKEVAEMLGMNYITLRSKVQRGRNRIKKMIYEVCAVVQDSAGGFADCTPRKSDSSCGPEPNCGCSSHLRQGN
ncbi:MAG: sigma-70 family RNA polymerase sigma factor [Balneolaceae bacterium]